MGGSLAIHTPLLTYKHAKGKDGTQVVPALAEDMPDISPDGKMYKLKLRPNMKYSDGTPIKASDFAYAIQRLFKTDSGGSVFFDVIVGATDYAEGKAQTISGIKTDDNTGDISIELTEPNGTFENVLGLMFAAPVPPSTPLDKDATNTPPPASGPFMISTVDAPRTLTMERNPNFQTVKDAGASEVADANVDKIIVNENKNNSAQVTHVEQNKVDFMLDLPGGGPPRRGQSQVQRSLPDGRVDQHLLLLHEHGEASVQRHQGAPGHQLCSGSRSPQQDLRWPAAPDAADPAAGHAWLPGSTSYTPAPT